MRKFPFLLIIFLLAFMVSCGEAPPAPQQTVAKPVPAPAPRKVVPPFSFTEKPTLDMIADHPIKGIVDGHEFVPGTLVFENEFNFFGFKMLEVEFKNLEDKDDLSGLGIDFELNGMPEAGAKFEKSLAAGEGIVLYRKGTGEVQSWSGENAWVIEFTKWDVKPFVEDPVSNLIMAGTASGRVAFCMKASSDGEVKESFASGTFTDVPVIYLGIPGWIE